MYHPNPKYGDCSQDLTPKAAKPTQMDDLRYHVKADMPVCGTLEIRTSKRAFFPPLLGQKPTHQSDDFIPFLLDTRILPNVRSDTADQHVACRPLPRSARPATVQVFEGVGILDTVSWQIMRTEAVQAD